MIDGDSLIFDERLANLFVPDVLLPSQYGDGSSRRSNFTGEHRLMLAILEDAIRVYCKEAGARNRRRRRLFRETEQWIESPDESWVFSFERICGALQLDADYIRRGLRTWKERAIEGQGPHALVIKLHAPDTAQPEQHREAVGG